MRLLALLSIFASAALSAALSAPFSSSFYRGCAAVLECATPEEVLAQVAALPFPEEDALAGGAVAREVLGSGVLDVSLSRARALNALDPPANAALLAAVAAAVEGDAPAAVVRAAPAASRAFCAGGDIKSALAAPSAEDFLAVEYAALLAVHALAQTRPVIGLGSGIVMGAGAGLLSACSHRVATETTAFAMPECAIGLAPDAGSSHFLAALPRGLARLACLTGARLSAADLLQTGLATHAVPDAALEGLLADLGRRAGGEAVAALEEAGAAAGRSDGALAFRDELLEAMAASAWLHGEMDRVAGGAACAEAEGLRDALAGDEAAWAAAVLEGLTDGSQAPASQLVACALLEREVGEGDDGDGEGEGDGDGEGEGGAAFARRGAALRAERFAVARLCALPDFREGVACAVGERKGEAPRWRHADWAAARGDAAVAEILEGVGSAR